MGNRHRFLRGLLLVTSLLALGSGCVLDLFVGPAPCDNSSDCVGDETCAFGFCRTPDADGE